MKYVLAIVISLFLGFNIGRITGHGRIEIDSKVYVPGENNKYRPDFWEVLGLSRCRGRRAYVAMEKSKLKQIGTTISLYYSDEQDSYYPSNPQAFDFDKSLFHPRHLRGKYIELPQDWVIPDSWEKLNQSNSPFVFLRSSGNYSASADIPLFITRYGYQAGENFYQVVYEDGHVGSISFKDAVVLWKQAGVWIGD